MQTQLALFPLNLVVYPNESLNLHIFEPRYRQLINDCVETKTNFGIPAYLNKQIQEYGTMVKIVEISNRYEDGRMDIKTKGLQIFRLQSFTNPMPDKLYAGGEVELLHLDIDGHISIKLQFLEALEELYQVLNVDVAIKSDTLFLSFEYAHKMGLSQQQEYSLLAMEDEKTRLRFLTAHIRKTIPTIREIERTKAIIRMNGHFKNLDPLKW
jgi:Lon protease-like protein